MKTTKRTFALLLLCLMVLAPMAQAAHQTDLARQVVSETNMERQKRGLSQLAISDALTRAAQTRAEEIVRKFSHTRPSGEKWSTVSSVVRGENIAKGHNSVNRVMAAWMSSDGHRRNILRPSFTKIGVAAYKVGNILYWAQLFG